MTSVVTNLSAMSALASLTATQKSIATTQSQVSTGLRVSSAEDDPSYWSIATMMRSDIGALGAVQDGLNLTSAIAQVTSGALNLIMANVQGIAEDLVTAQTAGVNKDVLQQDIAQRQANIVQVARSANFNGVNWLVGSRTANVDITEHHVLDQTYATIESEGASHVQASDPMPSYAPTETYYEQDPANLVASTQPLPTPYTYHDDLTYTATADETDAAGNRQSQSIAYQGNDLDYAYTDVGWESNYARPPATPAWAQVGFAERYRESYDPVSASNLTNSGSVDFRDAERDNVPVGLSGGSVQSMGIDTDQFLMFTDYTGTTTVSEDTTDAAGAVTAGNFTPLDHTDHSSTTFGSYTSYERDNGFNVDEGALDADVNSSNASNDLYSDPEDAFALSSPKSSVLNFDLRDVDPGSMLETVQGDLASLRSMASNLGSLQASLSSQTTFVSSLSDTMTAGVGSLVDADMNQASTRLAALQTQQQLGIQSLSIANDNSSLILKLFGA